MELPKPFLSRIIKSLEEIEQHIKPEQKTADNLFVPSQPRGDNGQWVKGSGTSGGGGTNDAPKAVPEPAQKKRAVLRRVMLENATVASDRLFQESNNEEEFIRNVQNYAYNTINYQTNEPGVWEVRGADRALNEGIGDCSERAQLIHKMLKKQGIDARLVYGQIEDSPDATWHDTVELHNGKYPRIIDDKYFPNFKKRGDGHYPDEVIVE